VQKLSELTAPTVTRLLEVQPDQLIELGHRLKQAAMDSAYPGDSVTAELSPGIWVVYHPEREFLKPVHKGGVHAVQSQPGPVAYDA
jgi:hypothetical protein